MKRVLGVDIAVRGVDIAILGVDISSLNVDRGVGVVKEPNGITSTVIGWLLNRA